MKQNFCTLFVVAFLSAQCVLAQGKFAGSYRSLINKTYQDKAQLSILNGFMMQGSTFIGDLSISWYKKGNLAIALFEGVSKNGYLVRDVLQLSNLSENQSLRFGNCLNARTIEDEAIVAVVTVANGDLLKATSAWRWNDEVKALETMDKSEAENISCPVLPMTSGQFTSAQWKPFVNRIYKDVTDIPALNNYAFRDGALLTGNTVGVNTYIQGNHAVFVFERVLEDNYRLVFDIIETTLTEAQEVRIGVCRRGNFDDVGLLAIVQKSSQKQWQAVKAWLCDTYHLAVSEVLAKEVTCLGNYGDN